MKATIYLYEEAPHILEDVEEFYTESEDVIILDAVEGRLAFNIDDVMRLEITK